MTASAFNRGGILINRDQFLSACALVVGKSHERAGIGTLGEKTLHAVLKHYFEPDKEKHEIKIGSFYADILNENGITEIQTRSFNALRKKLALFLSQETVTVVYPVAKTKRLVWVNGETGETTKVRKSPKTGSRYEVFFELYKIKDLLTHPNFRLCIVLLDLTEYRNLDGWSSDRKKGSSRNERIPEDIAEEIYINSLPDYQKLIPENLPEFFSVKDFKTAAKLSAHSAGLALNVLKYTGAVTASGKKGNAILYKKST